jgi:hypothetical protein
VRQCKPEGNLQAVLVSNKNGSETHMSFVDLWRQERLPKVIMKCFMMVVDLPSRYGSIFLLFPVTRITIAPTFLIVILNFYDFSIGNF